MRSLLLPFAVLALVATTAAAQPRLITTVGADATTYGGGLLDGTVLYRSLSEWVVGVRGLAERHEIDRESIFPTPPDTVATQTVAVVAGWALRPGGAFSRSTSRVTRGYRGGGFIQLPPIAAARRAPCRS